MATSANSKIPTILEFCSNSSATERKGEKGGRIASAEFMEGERKKLIVIDPKVNTAVMTLC
ncbi:hypothetical protein Lal_00038072 [Lupinus albus]|nr:hypothetical protein Lal_00038072 [Lupinus albus]